MLPISFWCQLQDVKLHTREELSHFRWCLISGCHHQVAQTERFKQQKEYFSQFWRPEVWDQALGVVRFWWDVSSWAIDCKGREVVRMWGSQGPAARTLQLVLLQLVLPRHIRKVAPAFYSSSCGSLLHGAYIVLGKKKISKVLEIMEEDFKSELLQTTTKKF